MFMLTSVSHIVHFSPFGKLSVHIFDLRICQYICLYGENKLKSLYIILFSSALFSVKLLFFKSVNLNQNFNHNYQADV